MQEMSIQGWLIGLVKYAIWANSVFSSDDCPNIYFPYGLTSLRHLSHKGYIEFGGGRLLTVSENFGIT
jgi:hypothetical protein